MPLDVSSPANCSCRRRLTGYSWREARHRPGGAAFAVEPIRPRNAARLPERTRPLARTVHDTLRCRVAEDVVTPSCTRSDTR
jgi:hypothetical protein